jgi:glycosyltransferase involved in cell wall biosynthesis
MGTVAVVVKGYPRLSETFVAQEIRELERRGIAIALFSLRHPTDRHRHPVHDEIRAPVVYLPEYLHDEPVRVLRAWWRARRLPGYAGARRRWLADLRRDPTRNRVRRFGQALVLADELAPGIDRLHAHFIHTPASVTRYAALVTGLPWSVSAHAKDIWTSPDWDLREKLAEADWAVTCTATGRERLAGLSAGREVTLAYHGIDLDRFPPAPARPARDGRNEADPVVVLSIGRAVPKKGFDVLIEALSRLPREIAWRFVHIGGGSLREGLAARCRSLGIDHRVTWLGPQPQGVVLENYRAADLFVLPSVIADDGDRDGLPNVLLEAASQGLACVTTAVSGIPEFIDDAVTGRIVPERDPVRLAAAIADLAGDPALRARLGFAAAERVRRDFTVAAGIGFLLPRFRSDPVPQVATDRSGPAPCASRSTPR